MKPPSTHALLLALSLIAIARNASPARAQDIVPNVVNQHLAAPGAEQKSGVVQTAYAGLAIGNSVAPSTTVAPTDVSTTNVVTPASATTTILPTAGLPAAGPILAPPAAQGMPVDAWVGPPMVACRTSSWTAGFDMIATRVDVTRAPYGDWPDDGVFAGRLILGYESPGGLGVRGRFWGLEQDAEAFSDDVQLTAGSTQLDFYKKLFLNESELALGGGLATSRLDFDVAAGYSRFEGTGLTMFAEGFHPFWQFPNIDFGLAGRARLSLMDGKWRDTAFVIPPTDQDTMSVTELAIGLEFRRHFGERCDHHWYVAVMAERQLWESAFMNEFAITNVGFNGINVSTGLVW